MVAFWYLPSVFLAALKYFQIKVRLCFVHCIQNANKQFRIDETYSYYWLFRKKITQQRNDCNDISKYVPWSDIFIAYKRIIKLGLDKIDITVNDTYSNNYQNIETNTTDGKKVMQLPAKKVNQK